MKIYGYTYELQPNGTVIKSAIRAGFLALVIASILLIFVSITLYEYNFLQLLNYMKTACDDQGKPVMSPAEFRLTIAGLTFIPVSAVITLLTIAFTGKTGQKYLEGMNLSAETPKQDTTPKQ